VIGRQTALEAPMIKKGKREGDGSTLKKKSRPDGAVRRGGRRERSEASVFQHRVQAGLDLVAPLLWRRKGRQ